MGTTTCCPYEVGDKDYTIPRNKWELQQDCLRGRGSLHYTIPRNKWELQPASGNLVIKGYYTIPRNKWELQPHVALLLYPFIIPYQEINGNYNRGRAGGGGSGIIPYQEINGNYNALTLYKSA